MATGTEWKVLPQRDGEPWQSIYDGQWVADVRPEYVPLVASAKKMLAALERLIDTIDPTPDRKPHLALESYFEEPLAQAREALAAAKGEAR